MTGTYDTSPVNFVGSTAPKSSVPKPLAEVDVRGKETPTREAAILPCWWRFCREGDHGESILIWERK